MLPIVISVIDSHLGKSKRLYARKCVMKKVAPLEAKTFFDKHHLMKGTTSNAYGLYFNDQLVACMSYVPRGSELHIGRFCNISGYTTVGAYSKLLKSIETNIKPNRIVNFVDLRYGNGKHLYSLGFHLEKVTLSWKWTDGKNTFNRLQCRANMDERRLTERMHAEEMGWYKIYDAGQAKFVKDLTIHDTGKVLQFKR